MISKWTKLLPVLMMIMACSVGGFLEEAFEESRSSFKFPAAPAPDAEDGETVEVDWHKLAGSRYRRCFLMLKNPSQMFLIRTLAIIVEPLRTLHCRFMYMSHQVKTRRSKLPSFLDELDDTRGIVNHVLQYFSSLLALSCGRARLLWQWTDAEGPASWIRDFPDQARVVRRLVLAAIAGVHRRFSKLTSEFPWLLMGLGDLRRRDGRDIAERFINKTKLCCLPPGLSRTLHSRGLAVDDLLSPQWRRYFFGVAYSIFGSIACVEKRHNHHRKLACPSLTWHNFAALSVTDEARRLQAAASSAAAIGPINPIGRSQAPIEDQGATTTMVKPRPPRRSRSAPRSS